VAPSSYSRRALYSDALYSEAMEPIMMIAPSRPYNPARYFDETLSSSLQVFKSLHENKNGVDGKARYIA